jgi:hypothetical protein
MEVKVQGHSRHPYPKSERSRSLTIFSWSGLCADKWGVHALQSCVQGSIRCHDSSSDSCREVQNLKQYRPLE